MLGELGVEQRGLKRHTKLHALDSGETPLGQHPLGGLGGFDDVLDVHDWYPMATSTAMLTMAIATPIVIAMASKIS